MSLYLKRNRKHFFYLLNTFFVGVIFVLLISLFSINQTIPFVKTSVDNPITLENKKPGIPFSSNDPIIQVVKQSKIEKAEAEAREHSGQAANPQATFTQDPINGYANKASINKGESIDFMISTTQPSYKIEVYRYGYYSGTGKRLITTINNLPGQFQETPAPDPTTYLVEANWVKSYTLQTDENWTTGAYSAKLTASNGHVSFILFVVRDDNSTADILYQVPTNTMHAYNDWGGTSLYSTPQARKVSYDRPYNNENGMGDFFEGDYTTIMWLESKGYNITYVTSVDVEANPNIMDNRKMFMTSFHDEYWSRPMRNVITNALNQGKSLLFMSANNVYWNVRYEPSSTGVPNRVIVSYKDNSLDPYYPSNPSLVTARWRDDPLNEPENALLGSMYEEIPTTTSWIVQNANHWVYENTGLNNGDAFVGAVGGEYDRIYNNGLTPSGTVSLSNSPVQKSGGGNSFQNATIYQAPSGAWVFNASTFYLGYKLMANEFYNEVDPRAEKMMTNIVNKMLGVIPTIVPPTSTPTPTPAGQDSTLIGHWKFDEGTGLVASNSGNVGNVLNGSLVNGVVWTTGKYGSGISLDGTNDYVQIPDNHNIDLSLSKDISYAFWLKRNSSTTSKFVISKGSGSTADTGYAFLMSSGTTPNAQLSRPGESVRLSILGTAINDTNWHHIVVTYKRSGTAPYQGILYVDGVQVKVGDISAYTGDLSNSSPLHIGCYAPDGGECFPGALDDLRIYNKVLNPTEITNLFNGVIPTVTDIPTPTSSIPTNSPTPTATVTATPIPTITSTPTSTPTPTNTPTPTSTPTPTPSSDVSIGLVAHWKFDETSPWINNCSAFSVLDSTSNILHGKSCKSGSGPTAAITGKLGYARSFSGKTSYVQVPNNNLLNFPQNQDFSYSLWIKRTNSTASRFVLSKGSGNTADTGYAFVMSGGKTPLIQLSKPGESARFSISSTALNDTNWHHIVATFDRDGMGRVYVDGVLKSTKNITSYNINLTNTLPLTIGCYSAGNVCFPGSIDDVRIYNRVLNLNEVNQLYNL